MQLQLFYTSKKSFEISAESDVRDILSPEPELLYYGGAEEAENLELQVDGNQEATGLSWDGSGAQQWY